MPPWGKGPVQGKIHQDPNYIPKTDLLRKLWQLLHERFAISTREVQATQRYLIDNQQQIAYENLLGQCTTGHSCKDAAKQELQHYVDNGMAGSGGNDGSVNKQLSK